MRLLNERGQEATFEEVVEWLQERGAQTQELETVAYVRGFPDEEATPPPFAPDEDLIVGIEESRGERP